MAHKPGLVARVKGALRAGLDAKQLAYWTGVPQRTIQKWGTEELRAHIKADETVAADMRDALLGDFLKSSER